MGSNLGGGRLVLPSLSRPSCGESCARFTNHSGFGQDGEKRFNVSPLFREQSAELKGPWRAHRGGVYSAWESQQIINGSRRCRADKLNPDNFRALSVLFRASPLSRDPLGSKWGGGLWFGHAGSPTMASCGRRRGRSCWGPSMEWLQGGRENWLKVFQVSKG